MKAFTRVLLKLFLLLLVIAVAAGGAVGWRTYQRSAPDYTMDRYLSLLINGDDKKAYELLDQSEEELITAEEFSEALQGKQYGLIASYTAQELGDRTDNNGSEYVDFRVEFKDAEGTVQSEENFTLKKQAKAALGFFDQWKVLSGHCMVKDLEITVPTGSEVYLDAQLMDAGWITRDDVPSSLDCYRIPSILPGKQSLVIRHPILESINTTLDTNAGNQDYSAQMTLKKSAQNECLELGISALKELYAGAVKQDAGGLTLFGACAKKAKKFVRNQGKAFHKENSAFQSVAVSKFAPEYGTPVFAEGGDSAITVEVKLGYHYLLREDVTADTEETQEDGTPVQETKRDSSAGDSAATFSMIYQNGAWSIASIEVPLISESK